MNEHNNCNNPWPSRGTKRTEESGSDARGQATELVSFGNSAKEEGQSCCSSEGFGFEAKSGTSDSNGMMRMNSLKGRNQSEEFASNDGMSFYGGGFGQKRKDVAKVLKSEYEPPKNATVNSYYAKVDVKEFSEASESHSQLGIKKESLFGEAHDHHIQRRRRQRSSRKSSRYEKICYHCNETGHFSKFCPQKGLGLNNFGDQTGPSIGFGDSGATDVMGSPAKFRTPSKMSFGSRAKSDYFSAYRYNDDGNEQEKNVDQLTRNLDAIFPNVIQEEEERKSRMNENVIHPKSQSRHNARRVPVNSLRSVNNVSPSLQQSIFGRNSANSNFDGFCNSPLASPSKSLREDRDKDSYQTIETRRKTMLANGQECEEWTCIKFPTSLPPNIKVVAAHLLPSNL
ncbi:unnamed protein product [Caenorhabditis angaria]|uniref:CCHC-type domain-containing protein n=1 Tax=Caenorhabditis angaria TaxID=860376 RepID=A0A9P1IID0_9PELO|nr:unnamed protein product [Caenorhabditis angaria]